MLESERKTEKKIYKKMGIKRKKWENERKTERKIDEEEK